MTDTVLSAFAGDASQMLNSVATQAARPNFNLAFSQMQNLAAQRYNDQVSAIQSRALDSYNVTIEREQKNLKELAPKVQDYQNGIINTRSLLLDRFDQFDKLDTLNASLQQAASQGQTVDPTEYNALVDNIKLQLQNLPLLNGAEFDEFGDNGVSSLRLNGAKLEHWSVDNSNANPPTGSSENLVGARTLINNALDLANNRLDEVTSRLDGIESRIGVIQSLLDTQTADIKKDVAKQAGDIKAQLSQSLNALSLGFEIQQIQNEKLNAAFTNDSYQPGSVVNLFS
ncbi:MAG: hypothetical protein HY055_13255 [Magnetospirillum sp.]|nr:hypothetical protein [Magnetospirillum sp.]